MDGLWRQDFEAPVLSVADPLRLVQLRKPEPENIALERGAQGPPVLRWRVDVGVATPPAGSCLKEFINLHNAPDRAFERFARKWGVLGLCEHGLPWVHARPGTHADHTGLGWVCRPLGHWDRWWESAEENTAWHVKHGVLDFASPSRYRSAHWEPLAAWRWYVAGYLAILKLAHELVDFDPKKQPPPPANLWRDALALTRGPMPGWIERLLPASDSAASGWERASDNDVAPARENRVAAYITVVEQLMANSGVRPALRWASAGPSLGLTLEPDAHLGTEMATWRWPTLSAVLSAELVAVISSMDSHLFCSTCGTVQIKDPDKRRPRAERATLCDRCYDDKRRNATNESARRSRRRARTTSDNDQHDGNPDGNR